MTINFYKNNSERKKLDKDIDEILTLEGTLRSETSIVDPVIMIENDGTEILNSNYMYIEEFNRYYYINNIRSIRNGLWEISAHVDVLMSYKDEIRANSAIISKQENNWNLYIDDGTFKVYQNPIIYNKKFPNAFNTFEFVLAVAGSHAAV